MPKKWHQELLEISPQSQGTYCGLILSSKFPCEHDCLLQTSFIMVVCPLSHFITFLTSISCPRLTHFNLSWTLNGSQVLSLLVMDAISLVDNNFCTYYFFSSLKSRIKLKIEIRSITRVLTSIWVKLGDLSFLYCINHITYVLLKLIFWLKSASLYHYRNNILLICFYNIQTILATYLEEFLFHVTIKRKKKYL